MKYISIFNLNILNQDLFAYRTVFLRACLPISSERRLRATDAEALSHASTAVAQRAIREILYHHSRPEGVYKSGYTIRPDVRNSWRFLIGGASRTSQAIRDDTLYMQAPRLRLSDYLVIAV